MLSRTIRLNAARICTRQSPPIAARILAHRVPHIHLHQHVSVPARWQSNSATVKPEEQNELLIEFTCNVCDKRSSHHMSKQAYEHGTVLIQCPQCKSRHLIADHLGFIRDDNFSLAEYLKSEGQSVDTGVLQFDKVPENLAHSTGQTAKEEEPKQQKVLDLEAPGKGEVVKDK
ncbi:uncharacterized protein LODBEIA_P58080 [Lodderomyces beijingensis]|uniref:DNL-type domain-containing protein n=1 Tax=Lodderomyces beijingensis TaxID=1775926 RepID=A0ABP0ZUK8_9ASCO